METAAKRPVNLTTETRRTRRGSAHRSLRALRVSVVLLRALARLIASPPHCSIPLRRRKSQTARRTDSGHRLTTKGRDDKPSPAPGQGAEAALRGHAALS